jgi:hypothetical protein
MAYQTLSALGWLTLAESAALLKAIFPNYPDLTPCHPDPRRK